MFPHLSSNTNFSTDNTSFLGPPKPLREASALRKFVFLVLCFYKYGGNSWNWRRGMILDSREVFVVQDIWLLSKQEFAFAPQINISQLFAVINSDLWPEALPSIPGVIVV